MKKNRSKFLLVISSIVIVLIFIISGYIIYLGSLDDSYIDVTITVDKSNYSINENIYFTLTLEDSSKPFRIKELSEGGGLCICRIPDNINPSQLLNNRSLLKTISNSPVERLALSNYSNDNHTLIITWNGTYCTNNNRLNNYLNGDVYFLAPSGYYIMFRSDLSSTTNDNILRFNVNENSLFYLDGLTPSVTCDYNNITSSLNINLSVYGNSINNGTSLNIQLALYETNGSNEEMTYYDQRNVSWNGTIIKTYNSIVSFGEGDWMRLYVIIAIPQGLYSIYWAEYHEV